MTTLLSWVSFSDAGENPDKPRAVYLASDSRITWDIGSRSRAILSAFHDAIISGDDPLSGGAPQLAALYTHGAPVQIGLIVGEHRFLNGLEVEVSPMLDAVEWRDRLGQRVEPVTGLPMPGARRFGRPGRV